MTQNPAPSAVYPSGDERVQPARAAAGEVEVRPTLTHERPAGEALRLFGHRFVGFKSEERICWACGYVVPRADEPATVAWMIDHEGGAEPHCGGAWHLIDRRPKAERP